MSVFYEDSYCGLFCGACEILLAYKRTSEEGRCFEWADFPEPIKNHISPARIECRGCKSDLVFEGCKKCKMRECAKNKQVQFCFECPDFPCTLLKEMKVAVDSLKVSLPHVRFIINNMMDIKRLGKDEWLKSQNEYWKCRKCGKRMGWYDEACRSCGEKIPRRY
ncbi:DUF3795 domain-containing protein [candidate division WOR-3 bacterium]|nr:DUF3795 domain-containing protein [candidate division WOR-3 bacterium]